MKLYLLIIFLLLPLRTLSEEIRSEILESSDSFLQQSATSTELLGKLREAKTEKHFNDEERLYLEDLTKKLPSGIRQELCPSFEEGLCAQAPHFQVWEEVPLLPTPQPPPKGTWISRNSKWILWAAVGFAGAAAWSLKDKEIQIHGFR